MVLNNASAVENTKLPHRLTRLVGRYVQYYNNPTRSYIYQDNCPGGVSYDAECDK